jgi:hypothetical protein
MSFSISSFFTFIKTNKHNESIFNSIGSSLGKSEANRNHFEQEINVPNDVDLIVSQKCLLVVYYEPRSSFRNDAGRNGYLASNFGESQKLCHNRKV